MPRNVYGPDHEAFRSSVREFVERTLRPRSEQMLEVKSIDRDIWKEAGKQGLFGLDIPEEFGGAGAEDYRFNAIAAEEISAFNFAVSSCFGIHSDVCPPYIVDLGTQEQKERWLPGMANGDLICAIAMTEPSGGSDLAALKTTAVLDRLAQDLEGMRGVGHRSADALLRQPLHHRDEAPALLPQPVGVGQADVVEEQLGGVGLLLADLVELAAPAEALHARLDHE